jgi:GNAT superfamily N-acetyltransferase
MSGEIDNIVIERAGPSYNMRPVAELARLVIIATYAGVQDPMTGLPITHEDLEYHTSDDWVDRKTAEFADEIRNQGAHMVVARAGEDTVAYRLRRQDRIGGGYYIHPKYQGMGLGKRLWLALPETVGKTDVRITVVPGTPAVDFYTKKLGFSPRVVICLLHM